MAHIIQKQILELTLNEGPNKMALQDDMMRRLKDEVMPALLNFFDEWVPENTVWKINCLELNLGAISPENFCSELLRELKQKIQLDFTTKSQSAIQVSTHSQTLLEQFIYFLQHGHFTWNANGLTLKQMEVELPQTVRQLTGAEKQRLYSTLHNEVSLLRLQRQFSTRFQWKLTLELLNDEYWEDLHKFFKECLPQGTYNRIPIAVLYTHSPISIHKPSYYLAQVFKELEHRLNFTPSAKESLQKTLLAKAAKEPKEFAQIVIQAVERWLTTAKEHPHKSLKQMNNVMPDNGPTSTEGIYIKNAGVVLLWPYLQRLFENLKLAESGAFVNRSSTEKAVGIIQRLVYPDDELAENQFPLNKILCGLDVAELVPAPGLTISNDDMEAAKDLLKAVITHWSKLGNTSVEGLQTSFLQREGRLKYVNEHWHLKVEQRSYDMLLDSLPWGISLIKLPWMPKPLHVEW